MADIAGASVFLVPPTIGLIDGVANGWGSNGALGLFIFGVPMAIIGTTYLASTIYGLHESRRCERMHAAEAEEFQRAEQQRPDQPERKPVVGDAPMYCALTEPDVGSCFAEETACAKEAEQTGKPCEPRNTTWCFDVKQIVGTHPDTTCAASLIDCESRRVLFTHDRTVTVTRCGTYAMRAGNGS